MLDTILSNVMMTKTAQMLIFYLKSVDAIGQILCLYGVNN